MLPDTTNYLVIWAGLGKRDAIQGPVKLAYRKSILSRICNDSTARRIIIHVQFPDRLEEIADNLEHLETIILYSETGGAGQDPALPSGLSGRFQAARFDELMSEGRDNFEPGPKFNGLAAIMYTSGTTGASKGVANSHLHSFCYADGAGEIFHLCPADRFYSSGPPLFHVGCQWAICYVSLIYGATVVLRRGYSNDHFWPDVKEHSCTVVFLLGAIANFLWQQPATSGDRPRI